MCVISINYPKPSFGADIWMRVRHISVKGRYLNAIREAGLIVIAFSYTYSFRILTKDSCVCRTCVLTDSLCIDIDIPHETS